jgi:glutaminyl-tRNA synthetase
LYDRLFSSENPAAAENFLDELNPDSLTVLANARLEPGVTNLRAGETVQFERLGYFTIDPDSSEEKIVLNRTVTLRDTWASKG